MLEEIIEKRNFFSENAAQPGRMKEGGCEGTLISADSGTTWLAGSV